MQNVVIALDSLANTMISLASVTTGTTDRNEHALSKEAVVLFRVMVCQYANQHNFDISSAYSKLAISETKIGQKYWDCMNACNLSGVVLSLQRDLDAIGEDKDSLAILLCVADKFCQLANVEGI